MQNDSRTSPLKDYSHPDAAEHPARHFSRRVRRWQYRVARVERAAAGRECMLESVIQIPGPRGEAENLWKQKWSTEGGRDHDQRLEVAVDLMLNHPQS